MLTVDPKQGMTMSASSFCPLLVVTVIPPLTLSLSGKPVNETFSSENKNSVENVSFNGEREKKKNERKKKKKKEENAEVHIYKNYFKL